MFARLVSLSKQVFPAIAETVSNQIPKVPKQEWLEFTPSSTKKLNDIMQENLLSGHPSAAIRLGLERKGCNGNQYVMRLTNDIKPTDEKIEHGPATFIIDKNDLPNIAGTKIDYVSSPTASKFLFTNPRAIGFCGCGDSFTLPGSLGKGKGSCRF